MALMSFLLLPVSSSAGARCTSHAFLLNAMYFLHISLSEALFVPSFKPALSPPVSVLCLYCLCWLRIFSLPGLLECYPGFTRSKPLCFLIFSHDIFFKSRVFVLWYSYISSPKLNLTFSALYDMLKLFLQKEENSFEWASGKLTKSCCLLHTYFL